MATIICTIETNGNDIVVAEIIRDVRAVLPVETSIPPGMQEPVRKRLTVTVDGKSYALC